MAAVVIAGSLTGRAAAQTTMDEPRDLVAVNPGVRLAYTFGEGFTLGFELSVVVVPSIEGTEIIDLVKRGIGVGYGFVLNYDFTFADERVGELHLGAEWVGPGIGVEAGVSLVHDPQGRYFGLSFTPWLGYYTLPYFNYTIVFGREENLADIGIMLKLHLCARDCPDADDDDFD